MQALLGAFCTLIWTNYRDLKTQIEANHKDSNTKIDLNDTALSIHKLHVAENYVTKSDLNKTVEALFNKLDRIENKLDGKQDKP